MVTEIPGKKFTQKLSATEPVALGFPIFNARLIKVCCFKVRGPHYGFRHATAYEDVFLRKTGIQVSGIQKRDWKFRNQLAPRICW